MSSEGIICGVYRDVNGRYFIQNESIPLDKAFDKAYARKYTQNVWCQTLKRWDYPCVVKTYTFKWMAIMKARELEDNHVRDQKRRADQLVDAQRRRTYVPVKVWR